MRDPEPDPVWLRGVTVVLLVLAGLTLLGTAGLAVNVRPGVASAGAPLLGPWAGVLWDHWDCTMANALPWVSWGAVAFGLFAGGVLAGASQSGPRMLGAVLVLLWSLFWCGLAVLSLINSTE